MANGAVFGSGDTPARHPSVYSARGEENGPVRSAVHKLALTDKGHGEAVLSQRDTDRFGLLGVSWTDPKAKIQGTIQARARSAETGKWTEWTNLEPYPAMLDGDHAGARGSTEPLWVGASDGAEVRISDGARNGKLPAGLRLDLVDPGTPKASSGKVDAEPAAFVQETPPTTPGPASTAPQPTVVTRAEWGADESISPEEPIYLPNGNTIKAAFVHHTADANPYDCSESAAIVRGIYTYHVKTNGWRDIGYNFLVDKCGTLFEGRKGGIDQPVYGAHTYGWNSQSTSVTFLGDYNQASPSDAALVSASRIIAYKLGQYGVDPAGKATLNSGATQTNYFGTSYTQGQDYTFNAVSGHRDGYNTECPGNLLYGQLGTIRGYASGSVQNLSITSVSGEATKAGSGYQTPGPATVNWSTSTQNSLVYKFEVLVDDQVAASTAGTARSASLTLSGYGDHTVAVRATHTSGKVTTSAPVTVTVPGPKTFKPVTPTRLMDTRSGLGVPKAKVGPGGEVVLQVTGNSVVPSSGVGAVVLNVTATNPTATSYVSVYPNGTDRTSASNLNFTAGQTIPNLVTVPVIDGKVRFFNHAGTVDLLADVTGYYTTDTSGSTHVNHGPLRLMDTRYGTGVRKGPVGPQGVVTLPVTGVQGVPAYGRDRRRPERDGDEPDVVELCLGLPRRHDAHVGVEPQLHRRPDDPEPGDRAGGERQGELLQPVGFGGSDRRHHGLLREVMCR
ncbi:N-acetylmuramoyl-L-alanine amidase [Streptomyces sp. Ru71]|nr:N-acetylmuramoyl-L-alanine amidase [Streptomyces sp. Ru71]